MERMNYCVEFYEIFFLISAKFTETFLNYLQARGKSGPLFSFDVRDDIRLVNDATVEKEESHAGNLFMFCHFCAINQDLNYHLLRYFS
jgi:hypothetical protein